MGNGYSLKYSKCCDAKVETGGNYGDYFNQCSSCKKDLDRYNKVYYKYFPSDYEKDLENRIERLEKIIWNNLSLFK